MDVAGRGGTISAERMKTKREHGSRSAVERWRFSTRRGDFAGRGDLVFPTRSGRPIAPSTLQSMLQLYEIPAVAHGFR